MKKFKRKIRFFLFIASLLLYLPACATSIADTGKPSLLLYNSGSYLKTELFFGLTRPDGSTISGSEWQDFVDNYITPNFKEGLTIIDSNGQWMGQSGQVVKEKSKIVVLLHKDSKETDRLIEDIRDNYKRLFQQESVLKVSNPTKVSF